MYQKVWVSLQIRLWKLFVDSVIEPSDSNSYENNLIYSKCEFSWGQNYDSLIIYA